MPLARVFPVSNVDHVEKEKCSPKKIKKIKKNFKKKVDSI
jgi:hypothetical protein